MCCDIYEAYKMYFFCWGDIFMRFCVNASRWNSNVFLLFPSQVLQSVIQMNKQFTLKRSEIFLTWVVNGIYRHHNFISRTLDGESTQQGQPFLSLILDRLNWCNLTSLYIGWDNCFKTCSPIRSLYTEYFCKNCTRKCLINWTL